MTTAMKFMTAIAVALALLLVSLPVDARWSGI